MPPSVPGSWFVVLPDHPGAANLPLRYDDRVTIIPHPSGRPWLVGDFPNALALVDEGDVRIALVGTSDLAASERLRRIARRTRRVEDLDAASSSIPGCYHLVASVGGTVRVQGGPAGVRRVFSTTYDGIGIAADRADLLASLRNAGPDDTRLALRLLALVPHPLSWLTMWPEVESVPGDCYTTFDSAGQPDIVRWWHPPEPELTAAGGVERLRDALTDAVRTRVASVGPHGRVSSDLSGGLDSTSLCFLAHRSLTQSQAPSLVAFSSVSEDPANDDMDWADLAATHLPGIDRIVTPPDPAGGPFADAAATGTGLDEPPMLIGSQWNLRTLATDLSERNVHMHLSGFGGDELLRGRSTTQLHALLRSSPLLALRHLRGLLAARRWRMGALLASAADRRTFGRWLFDHAATLDTAAYREPTAGGWGAALSLPEWATGRTVELVREQAMSAARNTPPLAETRAQHATIEYLQLAGIEARLREHMLAAAGHGDLAIGLPYLDDQVIRAVLSVRVHERETPWTYKPLLTKAMAGVLPTEFGTRITKGDASVDVHRGYRRHRKDLFDLFAGSLLHERGLLDLDRLRTALSTPSATDVLAGLGRTFACEAWLRNQSTRACFMGGRRLASGPRGGAAH